MARKRLCGRVQLAAGEKKGQRYHSLNLTPPPLSPLYHSRGTDPLRCVLVRKNAV